MSRKQADDLLMDSINNDLTTALFDDDEPEPRNTPATQSANQQTDEPQKSNENTDYDVIPGQLAVDVYETDDKLVIKARVAGVNRNDLDVSIADGVLNISGTLNSGDDDLATNWHMQECYWGEFSRTLVLPVPVKEDQVSAVLKDGVLTVSFEKIKQEQARRIPIN